MFVMLHQYAVYFSGRKQTGRFQFENLGINGGGGDVCNFAFEKMVIASLGRISLPKWGATPWSVNRITVTMADWEIQSGGRRWGLGEWQEDPSEDHVQLQRTFDGLSDSLLVADPGSAVAAGAAGLDGS